MTAADGAQTATHVVFAIALPVIYSNPGVREFCFRVASAVEGINQRRFQNMLSVSIVGRLPQPLWRLLL